MTHTQTQGADGAGTSLDDRLRAAGMFTVPEMMGETPLTRWQTHAAMTSLDAFEWWLDAQVRQYLTMKAQYEIGDKPKDDELYEWVLAHSGAFHVIRTNFRAAKAATPAPAATPGVPDSVRALSEAFAETACCASCTTPMDCYQGKPCRLEPVGSGSGVVDHEFKSHPDVFWPAARGEKTFEYRRDDRGGYEVGQTVRLRCYDLTRGYHDTAPLDRRVTNILRGGEFELPMGYCILSLAPLAAQPAGQSIGQFGTETIPDWLVEFVRSSAHTARFHALPHTEHWKTVERAAVWAASLQARRAEMLRTASECDDAEPGSGAYRRGVAQGIEEALADHPAPPEAQ